MNIGIDIRSTLKPQTTGVGHYILNLIRHLAVIDTDNSYYLYCRRRPGSRRKKLPVLPGENFHYRINFLKLPDYWSLKRLDVFHTPSYDLLPSGRMKIIVTIQDLIPKISEQTGENWHPAEVIEKFDHLIKNVLTAAERVIVTSDNTKKDLQNYYTYDSSRIAVIPLGVNKSFAPILEQKDMLYKKLELRYNIPVPYLLYVGTIEPRKNISRLIEAYSLLKKEKNIPHKLVIAGMKGWMYDDVFHTVIRLQVDEEVIFTGYIPDEDLKILYSLATAFIYPSLYEGFGLPLLEAMASGTPVITTNTGALAEVAGEAALLCDSKKPACIAQCIGRVLEDKTLATELVQKGLERARVFDWSRTARMTLDIYKEVTNAT